MKILYLIILIPILLIGCGENQGDVPQKSASEGGKLTVPVTVEKVKLHDLERYVKITGKLEGIVDIVMSSETSGKIIRVNKKLGDWVNKGEEIGSIDNAQYRIAVEQAEASVLGAEAAYENAELLIGSAEELYSKGSMSQSEYMQYRSSFKNAKAGLDGARAGLEAARKAYNNSRFLAPVSGYIADLHIETGETIAPGQPVCSIVNSKKMLIKTGVGEGDISKIQKGETVFLFHETLADPVEGIVRGVGIKPMAGTAAYPIEIELENEGEKLFPGMVVEGRIISDVFEKIIFTSVNNILEEYDHKYVYVINEDNKAERRDVELGPKVGEYVLISNGLKAGDKLVVEGFENLEEGTVVDIRSEVE
ncbi:efflux RND transporter periplasmic adaptor subunit [bacterium]|nr:efflux RND transporter periplasmic adaptor subunit [bacterium]